MAEWSITPTDGVVDNGNGNYTFTPPTSGERKYTITYTDGDLSGSMEYTVKSTDCYINPCNTNLTPPVVTPATVTNFSSEGGTVTASWTADSCWELITATTTNNVTNVTLTNPSTIIVTANTSTTEVVSIVTYKFKNEVANVTGQSKVTITQEVNPCYTSTTPPTVNFSNGTTATTVPAMGDDESRTAAVVIGTDKCWRLESYEFISPTPEGHAVFTNEGSGIKVSTNPSDNEIKIDAKYHFVNVVDSSIKGDRTIEITQPIGCNCNSITNYRIVSSTIQPTATTATICDFRLVSTCDINKVKFELDNNNDNVVKVNANSPKIVQDSTSGAYIVTAQTNTNTDGRTKSFTYHLSYNNVACDGLTGKTTQGIGCICDDINFTQNEEVNFSTDAATVTLGTISPKESCRNVIGISGDSNFTSVTIEGNTVKGSFGTFQQDISHNGRILKFKFTMNGAPCNETYEIYQQAFRGTDNGVDMYADGTIKSYPIYFAGDPDDTQCSASDIALNYKTYNTECSDKQYVDCTRGNEVHNKPNHADADSIVCPGGAYFYDEENDTYHHIDSNWTGKTIDNWLFVDASCDDDDCDDGTCNVGMIRLRVTGDTVVYNPATPVPRIATFWLASQDFKNDPTPHRKNIMSTADGCSGNPQHAGKECALKWRYDVWQLPKGYYMCYEETGDTYHYNEPGYPYELKKYTEPCPGCEKKQKGECKCKCNQSYPWCK